MRRNNYSPEFINKLIPPSPETEIQSLERFVNANQELEDLESILGQFNVFEAVGAVQSELRHSDFLAFLLNPNESHGLNDGFLKLFLKRACATAKTKGEVGVIDVDSWNLTEMLVEREWEGIDILLVHEAKRAIIWIENKIGTMEHSDQLARYYKRIGERFSGFKRLPLFLTPDGSSPSHPSYFPIDYGLVAHVIKTLGTKLAGMKHSVDPAVHLAIQHYEEMLRRHIMTDSKVAELARAIYQKHKKALDIIFEHKPDQQQKISEYLIDLIKSRGELKLDNSSKTAVRFCACAWDERRSFKSGFEGAEGWTPSKRISLFEFKNNKDSLALYLILGPGERTVREKVFTSCKEEKEIFKGRNRKLTDKWTTLWKMPFLTPTDYKQHNADDLFPLISIKWSDFLSHKFQNIEAAISKSLD